MITLRDFLESIKRVIRTRRGPQRTQVEHDETTHRATQTLQPSEGRLSPKQVFFKTWDSFAEADAARLAISHGGEVPLDVEQQALQIVDDHVPEFGALSSVQALNECDTPLDRLDELAPTQVPHGLQFGLDHSESQLNSEELLNERIPDCLQFLIAGLENQLGQCEDRAESNHGHVARLHLTGFEYKIDEAQLFFDLYLSSRSDWTPCRWLDSRCIVKEAVRGEQAETPGCGIIRACEETKKRLCILLGERQGGQLLLQQDIADCYASIATPTVSLGKLLDSHSLKRVFECPDDPNGFLPRDKATLCLNLALSLLQLSQKKWRQIVWCPESIFFRKNPLSGAVEEKSKPYLSWDIMSTVTVQDNSADEPTCDPHLLDFARLLMEIHAGERLRAAQRGRKLQVKLLETIQNRYIYLPVDNMFVAAVTACLSPESKTAAAGESGANDIRDFIYRKIVLNLACSIASKDKLPPDLSSSSALGNQPTISCDSGAIISQFETESCEKPSNEMNSRTAKTFCDNMHRWLNKFIVPLGNKNPPKTHVYCQQKIKIAVIDSGAKTKDPRIRAALQGKRIKEGRNFLPSTAPEDWDDVDGHGTIVTSLLLDFAPNAEIYVAKITDQVKIDSRGLFCVSQAINWAIQNWQVDIISMSFVVNGKHEDIEEQLAQAIDPSYEGPGISRKIVFAAAGNLGGNASIGWLAKRKNVIAIHATDGLGTPININPSPNKEDDNFATLGRDIESKCTLPGGVEEKVYVTGTSFATPIAAAIAANVLEFSRHELPLTSARTRFLYTETCMRKIFKKNV